MLLRQELFGTISKFVMSAATAGYMYRPFFVCCLEDGHVETSCLFSCYAKQLTQGECCALKNVCCTTSFS